MLAPFTDDDFRQFSERYLQIKEKYELPSGEMLEDVVFQIGMSMKRHEYVFY
jgi:hypothetical protein